MIDYVDEEKEGYVTKGVTTLALFLIKLTFAILEKQEKWFDTAWPMHIRKLMLLCKRKILCMKKLS